MAAYLMSRARVTDPDLMKQYAAKSGPLAQKHGATYVFRGNHVEALEGDFPGGRVIVAKFPDVESFRAFWNSPEYQELKKLRLAASEGDVWLVVED